MAEKSGQDPMKSIFEASRGKTSFPSVTSDLLTPPIVVRIAVINSFCKPCCAAQRSSASKDADVAKGTALLRIKPLIN